MCWKVNDDDSLTYSKDCSTKFLYTTKNRIIDAETEKCVAMAGTGNGYRIIMTDSCDNDRSVFVPAGDSFRNPSTDKCIHPKTGRSPAEGETLVIYSGCDESRLSHKFMPGKNILQVPN